MEMFNPPHPGGLLKNQLIRDENGNELDSIAHALSAVTRLRHQ